MDAREVSADHLAAVRTLINARLTRLWTAIPGEIESFDATAMTCQAQPNVQGRVTQADGSVKFQDLPLLVDCPVVFPSGGGCAFTLPLKQGDECLIVFSSRCMDAWWQQGGSQPPMEARMHDLSDGFVIPGIFSQPNVLSDVSTETAQLRTDDGQTYVEVDPNAGDVNLKASGKVTITAPAVTVISDNVSLGDTGGPAVARVGDTVNLSTGLIETGSSTVSAAG